MNALRLAGLVLLLLLSACAHRAYYVFGPEDSEGTVVTPPPDRCVLDFRGLVLGRSTVADLRRWYFELLKQPKCRHTKLRFHRPGGQVVGPEYSPDAADLIQQIMIDSNPERPRLAEAAVIRAVAAPALPPPPPPSCPTGGQPPCESRPPASTSSLVYVETEIETYSERLVPVEIVKQTPVPPPPPPEVVTKRETVEKRSLQQVFGPAVIGGGIVYALAYFQMLPFAAAGAIRPRASPARAQWGLEDREAAPLPAVPDPEAPGLLRDPRVRIRALGFRKATT